MNILERVKDLYDECGVDMFKDISAYLAYGYIHKTPKSFILAKTVDLNSKTKPSVFAKKCVGDTLASDFDIGIDNSSTDLVCKCFARNRKFWAHDAAFTLSHAEA